jgi:lipoate---protein ligase
MLYLNYHSETPALDLALEEAILDQAEQGLWHDEYLRIWQPATCFAVIGRGSRIAEEVDLELAAEEAVQVFRRISGGAAVVAGPGCLLYAVMLSMKKRPALRMVDIAHDFVMQQMLAALQPLEPELTYRGTCDLVVGDRKVSGNSLRVRRDWVLYHGTLLLNMNLEWIDRLLKHPPREPEYRRHRRHSEFVANLELDAKSVTESLKRQWNANEPVTDLPLTIAEQLVQHKYSQDSWNRDR